MQSTHPWIPHSARLRALAVAAAFGLVGAATTPAQVQWTEMSATLPRPPWGEMVPNGLVHDAVRDRLVLLFTVGTRPALTADVWEWDGSRWSNPQPSLRPGRVREGAAVFDPVRGQTMVIAQDGTWLWDGTSWRLAGPPPAHRGWASMAFDRARGEAVLFGGGSQVTSIWDGSAWTHRTSASLPPARNIPGMAYDSLRERVVLFGGNDGGTALGDTWEWDGVDWTLRVPPVSPTPRTAHTMAYDQQRARVVLYGGGDGRGNAWYWDTWEWDGVHWQQRLPSIHPRANWSHGMTYDSRQGCVWLFGGANAYVSTEDALWRYGPTNAGTLTVFGTGCAGSAGTPALWTGSGRRPYAGGTFDLDLTGLGPAASIAGFAFGPREPQPIPLDALGIPGCSRWVRLDVSWTQAVTGGRARIELSVPGDPTLVGARGALQAWAVDPGAPNALGVAASGAVEAVVGGL